MENKDIMDLVKSGNFWFPEGISTFAKSADSLFYFILVCSLILMLGLLAITLYFVIKYRRTPKNLVPDKHVTHHDVLETTWTVIPTLLVLFIFYWGYKDFLKISLPPMNAEEIYVVGQKWMWNFDYPKSGKKSMAELVVPVHVPIKLIMTSKDVLHSFFVPNFRIKRDVVPNRYTRIWFEAQKEGLYHIFCTEFCGDGHSKMLGAVRVVSEHEYAAWLKGETEGEAAVPSVETGKKIYTQMCSACHSLDGSKMIGPSWKGIFGTKREFVSGASVDADENYIRESIENPNAKIVKGFAPQMASFSGLLSEKEMGSIIEFIKSLK